MIKSMLDTLMEKSVIPSFSSLGPAVRSRLFDWTPLENYKLNDKVVVLTGGTSGIGRAGASLYAKLGATLVIVGRNREKTTRSAQAITQETGNHHVHCVIGDLGSSDDVRRVATELAAQFPVIDVLVHNAGALYNERRRASNGTDLSVELMVATPFLLTGLLLPQLRARTDNGGQGAGRVLTMSSGGMYTQGLTVDALEMPDDQYHGARQYARAKRAQVVLNELWASHIDLQQTVFHALHPGWVDTPGITEALPGFSRLLSPLKLLRSPRNGADTMIWLSVDESAACSTGLFWHDRAVRKIDMSAATRCKDTESIRKELWRWCETHTGWSLPEYLEPRVQVNVQAN